VDGAVVPRRNLEGCAKIVDVNVVPTALVLDTVKPVTDVCDKSSAVSDVT
jgi:hypothetical protein